MNKKYGIISLIIISCLIALVCWPRKVILRIGIFAGSNWDVPSGDCYVIIDEAIERLKKLTLMFK